MIPVWAWSLARAVAPWAASAVAGAALLHGVDTWAPWGFGPRLHRQEIVAADALGRLAGAQTALAERDAAIKTNAATARTEAGGLADFWKDQVHAAFTAGRATCPRVPGAGAGDPAPAQRLGLRDDLRALWSAGAYAPGVPREP